MCVGKVRYEIETPEYQAESCDQILCQISGHWNGHKIKHANGDQILSQAYAF